MPRTHLQSRMWQKGQSCVFTARADYCECDNGLSSCSLVLVILESYPPLSWESGSILAQGIFSGCDWSRMKPNLSGHLWMINADMGLRPALRKTWVALINWGIINTLAYTSFSGEKHYRKRQMKRQGAGSLRGETPFFLSDAGTWHTSDQ